MDLLTFLTLLDEPPEAVLSSVSVESGRRSFFHVRCLKAWLYTAQQLRGIGVVARFAERYAVEVASKQDESVRCTCCGKQIRWTS